MITERKVDLTGLKCPMPIVKLTKLMKELDPGEALTATADDAAFCLDVESWCNSTGHELVRLEDFDKHLLAVIRKKDSPTE